MGMLGNVMTHIAKQTMSIRTNTWFAKSKLTIQQILTIIYCWYIRLEQSMAAIQANTSCKTMVDWYSFCRGVCLDYLLLHSEQIGGPGKIVEIDESAFGKRKYNKGKRKNTYWIFGGIERDSYPVKSKHNLLDLHFF